ncbi:MAG: glutaredoxin family protein [Nevskiales bacterium]
MAEPVTLILYSRHACHLCDVMQAELQARIDKGELSLELRDVDLRAEWRSEYGLRVPVLVSQQAEVICEYHLDDAQLDVWLNKTTAKSM